MNRRLNLESLEHRLLLAADVAFQNPLLYQDVNFDSHVSQVDALQVINHLRQWKEEGNLPSFITPELADRVLSSLEDIESPLGRIFRGQINR